MQIALSDWGGGAFYPTHGGILPHVYATVTKTMITISDTINFSFTEKI